MNIDFDDDNQYRKWCLYRHEDFCGECIWCDTEEEAQEINNELYGGNGHIIYYNYYDEEKEEYKEEQND